MSCLLPLLSLQGGKVLICLFLHLRRMIITGHMIYVYRISLKV